MYVLLAQTIASDSVARRPIVERSLNVTIAWCASSSSEIVKIILASVTLIAINAVVAVTLSSIITLFRLASISIASARNTAPVLILEETFLAQLAFRSIRIILTFDAATMSKLVVVNTGIGEAVAVAFFAFFRMV